MQNIILLGSSSPGQNYYPTINPQFVGIGRELNQTHLSRKHKQLEEKQLANRVGFLEKERDSAEKNYQRKQRELEKLMGVIARKQQEEDQKEQLRRQRQQKVAQLRQDNLRKRSQHQDNLRNAMLELYQDHRAHADSAKHTLNKHEIMRRSFRIEELAHNRERALQIEQTKQQGKLRELSFHKTRNDYFTQDYKSRIQREREDAERAAQTIQSLSLKESDLKLKLERSANKLDEIEQTICNTARSRVRPLDCSYTRSFYQKNMRTVETKMETSKEDPKLDRFIQKQMSISEYQISRL